MTYDGLLKIVADTEQLPFRPSTQSTQKQPRLEDDDELARYMSNQILR